MHNQIHGIPHLHPSGLSKRIQDRLISLLGETLTGVVDFSVDPCWLFLILCPESYWDKPMVHVVQASVAFSRLFSLCLSTDI
jgi:hypothetical protein